MPRILAPLFVVFALFGVACATQREPASPGRLEPVSVAPDFSAPDETGTTRSLAEFRGHPVVLYFYPKDGTPGCTREACAFRDEWQRLTASGAQVVGVSLDSVESHAAFKSEHHLPFPLLSDPDGRILAAYGVPRNAKGYASRTTFIIDAGGVIRRIFPEVDPAVHVQQVLEVIEQMKAQGLATGPHQEASCSVEASTGVDKIKDEVVQKMNSGDSKGLFEMFGPAMKDAVPEDKTAQFVSGIAKDNGQIKSANRVPGKGNDRHGVYELELERGKLSLDLVVSPDGKILGLSLRQPPPAEPEVKKSTIPLALPFRGQWFVFWGGETLAKNQHVTHPSQRRAADLLRMGADGKTFTGDGKKNSDYLAYGQGDPRRRRRSGRDGHRRRAGERARQAEPVLCDGQRRHPSPHRRTIQRVRTSRARENPREARPAREARRRPRPLRQLRKLERAASALPASGRPEIR